MSLPVNQQRQGFFDPRSNTFYLIESEEEFERCLAYYWQVQEAESGAGFSPVDSMDDFDHLVGELVQKHQDTAPLPVLQKY